MHLNLFSQISSFVMISISHSEMLWVLYICFKHLSHISCSGIHDLIQEIFHNSEMMIGKARVACSIAWYGTLFSKSVGISQCEHVVAYIKSLSTWSFKRAKMDLFVRYWDLDSSIVN